MRREIKTVFTYHTVYNCFESDLRVFLTTNWLHFLGMFHFFVAIGIFFTRINFFCLIFFTRNPNSYLHAHLCGQFLYMVERIKNSYMLIVNIVHRQGSNLFVFNFTRWFNISKVSVIHIICCFKCNRNIDLWSRNHMKIRRQFRYNDELFYWLNSSTLTAALSTLDWHFISVMTCLINNW